MKPFSELRQTVTRCRRQTRDAGLLDVFEALEEFMAQSEAPRPKRDRRLYMRNLMRDIRKKDRERKQAREPSA